MGKRTFDEVKTLVQANNRSTVVSDRLLVCMIWKESGFDDQVKNAGSSATGLMQVTRDAVTDVNHATPAGVHYGHSDMTDAARNIQCGSYYLDIRINRVKGDVKKGIERYGTGSGYADNILACEDCLPANWDSKDESQLKACLFAIHK